MHRTMYCTIRNVVGMYICQDHASDGSTDFFFSPHPALLECFLKTCERIKGFHVDFEFANHTYHRTEQRVKNDNLMCQSYLVGGSLLGKYVSISKKSI